MRLLSISILLFISNCFNAQGFKVRPSVPAALNQYSKFIFETNPNNYIAGGLVLDTFNGAQINRIAMMGLDQNGQVLWTKKYGNEKLIYVNNPFITRSFYKQGNFIYYACNIIDSTNRYIGGLLKFDLNGDTLWQKYYRDSDPYEDVVPQMVTGSVDGGFLITGFFQNNGTYPYSKCLLIKTDANGNELWRKKLAKLSPNVQDGKAIIQDGASKKIVIAGYQYIGGVNIYDNILITDSLGGNSSQYAYFPVGGVLNDLIQTRDKKIVIAGYQYYSQTVGGSHLMRPYAAKFDIDTPGNPKWKIGASEKLVLNNGALCLKETQDGDILIGGMIDTMQLNNLPTNCLTRITKFDKNGNLKSNRYYDYKTNDQASDNNQSMVSLELTQDGGYVAAIQTLNMGFNPFFFVKYDSNGCDSTLAYCATLNPLGVSEIKAKNNFRIYPNPAKDLLVIETDFNGKTELNIYDVAGRVVKKINMNGKTSLSVGELEQGIYFIRIISDTRLLYSAKLIKE